MSEWPRLNGSRSPHGHASSAGAASPSSLSQQLGEQDLRHELQECQRSLVQTQAATVAADARAQEAEEAHQQELAILCAQLDALDQHLLAEHRQQSEESATAQNLLRSAQGQLDEMRSELRSARDQAEIIESESRHGRPELDAMASRLQRSLKEEEALVSEVGSLRMSADQLRCDLTSHLLRSDELGERRLHLEEGVERANGQISSFEHWSEGVHEELRQVASELHEDRLAGEMEKQSLQARAVALERNLMVGESGLIPLLPAEEQPRFLARHADAGLTVEELYQRPLTAGELYQEPLRATEADPLGDFTLGRRHDLQDTFGSSPSDGQRPPRSALGAPDLATPVPVPSPLLHAGETGATITGYEFQRPAPSPARQSPPPKQARPGALAGPTPLSQSPSVRASQAAAASPHVLWCRKAPSQTPMSASPSAPVLV